MVFADAEPMRAVHTFESGRIGDGESDCGRWWMVMAWDDKDGLAEAGVSGKRDIRHRGSVY